MSGPFARFKAVLQFIGRSSKRVAVSIVGGALVVAGIAGLVAPVIPGWLLLIPGLAILATEYVWARRMLDFAKDKATQARRKAGRMMRRKKKPPTT